MPVLAVKQGVVLLGVSWGLVSEFRGINPVTDPLPQVATSDTTPILHALWFQDVYVPPVYEEGECRDYPWIEPLPGTWEAFLAGTLPLQQFLTMNPGIGINYDPCPPCEPRWVNDRILCEEGHWPPPTLLVTPGYWIFYPRHELWGDCNGQEVLLECGEGSEFEWFVKSGNPGPGCTLPPAIYEGGVAYFIPCDVNFDGMADLSDAIAYQAAPYDWNRDGMTNGVDLKELLDCIN